MERHHARRKRQGGRRKGKFSEGRRSREQPSNLPPVNYDTFDEDDDDDLDADSYDDIDDDDDYADEEVVDLDVEEGDVSIGTGPPQPPPKPGGAIPVAPGIRYENGVYVYDLDDDGYYDDEGLEAKLEAEHKASMEGHQAPAPDPDPYQDDNQFTRDMLAIPKKVEYGSKPQPKPAPPAPAPAPPPVIPKEEEKKEKKPKIKQEEVLDKPEKTINIDGETFDEDEPVTSLDIGELSDLMNKGTRQSAMDMKSGIFYYPPDRRSHTSQYGLLDASMKSFMTRQAKNKQISMAHTSTT